MRRRTPAQEKTLAVPAVGFSCGVVRRSGSEVALNANIERQLVNEPEQTGAGARPLVQVQLVTRIH